MEKLIYAIYTIANGFVEPGAVVEQHKGRATQSYPVIAVGAQVKGLIPVKARNNRIEFAELEKSKKGGNKLVETRKPLKAPTAIIVVAKTTCKPKGKCWQEAQIKDLEAEPPCLTEGIIGAGRQVVTILKEGEKLIEHRTGIGGEEVYTYHVKNGTLTTRP